MDKERAKPEACPRCHGRMVREGNEGDSACFTCGHVAYGQAPLEVSELAKRRRPTHGGRFI